MKPFYQLSAQDIARELETDLVNGLAQQEVQDRLQRYGLNALPAVKEVTWLLIIIRQFKNPLVYILLIAGLLLLITGHPLDAVVICIVVLLNAVIGAIQEGRTQTMLEELRSYLKTEALVMRDGKRIIINAENVVPGDILVLQEGDKVSADARLIEADDLLINESMLTGETEGIKKTEASLSQETRIADQSNMVFKGTLVLAGEGTALVVRTGVDTQIGQIGAVVEGIDTDMPLKKEIDKLSFKILYFIVITCAFLFLFGLWQGRAFADLFVIISVLFVCAIPEGLPVILTLTLVSGAYRMAQNNVLIKQLQAAEGLGRTDVIIIDKTGTLTRNEMIVSHVVCDGHNYTITGKGYASQGAIMVNNEEVVPTKDGKLFYTALAAYLLNDAKIEYDQKRNIYTVKGDPTEAAMQVFSNKVFGTRDAHQFELIRDIPFSTQKRYQAGIYAYGDNVYIFILGAPEVIMQKSTSVNQTSQQYYQELLDAGFRIIGAAMKVIAKSSLPDNLQHEDNLENILAKDFEFLSFMAIEDALRPDVADIIKNSRDAGLKVVMATGDHRQTALFVAKKVNIFREGDQVVTGQELATMSEKELLNQLDTITVFARVSPEEKLDLVHWYQQKGNVVAMTGDGVNDAPSLVAADLGIAMGGIGTQVAKNAADLILLDDAFESIIQAIEQGRYIFRTLRRVVMYFFTTNMAEVLIIFFTLVLGLPLPLLAVHIIWLNLVTDGFLDIALAMEPQHMQSIKTGENTIFKQLIDWSIVVKMLYISIPMALGTIVMFWANIDNIILARTVALTTLSMYQWVNAWNCRSETRPLMTIGIFSNKWLWLATIVVVVLQLFVLYMPPMHYIFKTVSIGANQWLFMIAITLPILVLEELKKLVTHYFLKGKTN